MNFHKTLKLSKEVLWEGLGVNANLYSVESFRDFTGFAWVPPNEIMTDQNESFLQIVRKR